jgi:hypothetical protein
LPLDGCSKIFSSVSRWRLLTYISIIPPLLRLRAAPLRSSRSFRSR